MNLARGLFRLWLVVSVMWIVGVGSLATFDLARKYDRNAPWVNDPVLYPVACDKARGVKGIDYEGGTVIEGPWDRYTCWYSIESIRRLYPEYTDVSDATLGQRLYEVAGRPLQSWWSNTLPYLFAALAPPAAVLAVGSALAWAVAGFRRTQS